MPRFFIEVAYKGTNYAGFQKQDNANTIQAEVEKALKVYFKEDFDLPALPVPMPGYMPGKIISTLIPDNSCWSRLFIRYLII